MRLRPHSYKRACCVPACSSVGHHALTFASRALQLSSPTSHPRYPPNHYFLLPGRVRAWPWEAQGAGQQGSLPPKGVACLPDLG